MLNISVNRFATSSKQKKNLQKIMEDLDTTPHYTHIQNIAISANRYVDKRALLFNISHIIQGRNHRRIPFNF